MLLNPQLTITIPTTRTIPSADGGYAHYGAAKAAIAHYTRYLAQDLGPFGITANCISPGVIATGRIMATIIPGSIQSNRDRAELVALRRLGTVEDCAKVVEFLSDRPFRLCDRRGDPDRRRLGSRMTAEHLASDQSTARGQGTLSLYKNIHGYLYREVRHAGGKGAETSKPEMRG